MSDTPKTDAEYLQWGSVDDARDFCRELERENAALRLDKARLDWLDQHSISRLDLVMVHIEWNKISVREAIDAARKEAQP